MIRQVVTCDMCNPRGEAKAHPSGSGFHDGDLAHAKQCGWARLPGKRGTVGPMHVCPQCLDEAASVATPRQGVA